MDLQSQKWTTQCHYKKSSLKMIFFDYVDDIILVASTDALLQSLIVALSSEFAMKDLRQLNYFLGIEAVLNFSLKISTLWSYLRNMI